ncbi:hypothetical protein EYF80_008720 [Liparis tanakae]|uniref:Uncharacterized protein n=1 Tax=Liparis tanakae TaxID=230148 RepID=A0A4Z2IU55_9TELE|nr:hypothetical protein EYF80_008720 [Liparis tanakae]
MQSSTLQSIRASEHRAAEHQSITLQSIRASRCRASEHHAAEHQSIALDKTDERPSYWVEELNDVLSI